MSAEYKTLTKIEQVVDTDSPYYEIGEISGSFNEDELKSYIRKYGHEKLSSKLTFLSFQVWEAVREVNSENQEPAKSNT